MTLSERTIFFEVATLVAPTAEPFAVIMVDTSRRVGNGVEGTVHSLHWTEQEAKAASDELNRGITGEVHHA